MSKPMVTFYPPKRLANGETAMAAVVQTARGPLTVMVKGGDSIVSLVTNAVKAHVKATGDGGYSIEGVQRGTEETAENLAFDFADSLVKRKPEAVRQLAKWKGRDDDGARNALRRVGLACAANEAVRLLAHQDPDTIDRVEALVEEADENPRAKALLCFLAASRDRTIARGGGASVAGLPPARHTRQSRAFMARVLAVSRGR